MSKSGKIRIGIGGWTYAPWRKTFYPEGLPHKDELAHAASVLTAIEINGTFYRTQSPKTFAAWRDAAPEGFVFTVKAPRYATNRKVLGEAGESIARFAESGLAELGDKLGPILWQFATSKSFDPDDFAAFLDLLPGEAGGQRLRHAVELRHASFRTPEMVALASRHGIAIVWATDSEHPEIADRTADFAYVRLLGTTEGETLGYAEAALASRAAQLEALARGAAPEGVDLVGVPARQKPKPCDVFAFVIGGHKVSNPAAAKALLAHLG